MLSICDRVTGMVVANVSDVITLGPEQIKVMSEMGVALGIDYLIRLGTLGERMLILIDIERLVPSKEIGLIEKLAA